MVFMAASLASLTLCVILRGSGILLLHRQSWQWLR